MINLIRAVRILIRRPRIIPHLEKLVSLSLNTERKDKFRNKEQMSISKAAWDLVRSIRGQ